MADPTPPSPQPRDRVWSELESLGAIAQLQTRLCDLEKRNRALERRVAAFGWLLLVSIALSVALGVGVAWQQFRDRAPATEPETATRAIGSAEGSFRL